MIEVPNGWTPKGSCDDHEVEIFAVVGSVPAEELLPRGMWVVKDVEPLSLSLVSCGGELFKEVFDEFEKSGRGRQVARGPPGLVGACEILNESGYG